GLQSDGGSGGWMSVPAFGEWDMKNGVPDYSMDFTKIREMRKQNKNTSRASLGNDDELRSGTTNKEEQEAPRHSLPEPDLRRRIHHHHGSPTSKNSIRRSKSWSFCDALPYLYAFLLVCGAGEEEVYGLLPVLYRSMKQWPSAFT
ncbi:unnamed protein product, partial [Musa acuminata subsp. burmannicoides]